MPLKGSYVDLIPAGAPSAVEGRVYYDSTNKKLYYYDGTLWKELGAVIIGDIIGEEVVTTSGSIAVPSGAKYALIIAVGGGGGGGGGNGGETGGGGGSGGVYASVLNLSGVTSISVGIGSGGEGGTMGKKGQDGGNTVVTVGSKQVVAEGGKGGTGGNPDVPGFGGSRGATNIFTPFVTSGGRPQGGSNPFGTGGQTSGANGSGYGAGGAGGVSANGGKGTPGIAFIYWL